MVRISGSATGASLQNEIQDEVPRHAYAPSCGATTPAPTAAMGPSPPPMTTRVSRPSPVALAASAVSVPTTVVDSSTPGKIDASSSAAAIISDDHVPRPWSYALVAEASDRSVASRPVSRLTT